MTDSDQLAAVLDWPGGLRMRVARDADPVWLANVAYKGLFATYIAELGCWAHARRKFFRAARRQQEHAGA